MGTLLRHRDLPDVGADEKATREIVKRIAKLRWMGMDDEAEQMQAALRAMDRKVTLVAEPGETD